MKDKTIDEVLDLEIKDFKKTMSNLIKISYLDGRESGLKEGLEMNKANQKILKAKDNQ